MMLSELDTLWEGQNVDKANLKSLCRKYSPQLVMDWIHRGMTQRKDLAIKWHKEKMAELGEPIQEVVVVGDINKAQDYGDYFSDVMEK